MKARLVSRVRVLMQEYGWIQDDLARETGMSNSAAGNFLSLANYPDEEAMVRLCEITGVSMDWLYRGNLDSVPTKLAIRLQARLLGLDPEAAHPGVLSQKVEMAQVRSLLGKLGAKIDYLKDDPSKAT
jgi:transcriptional regulator with XRE-family HTH domain